MFGNTEFYSILILFIINLLLTLNVLKRLRKFENVLRMIDFRMDTRTPSSPQSTTTTITTSDVTYESGVEIVTDEEEYMMEQKIKELNQRGIINSSYLE